VHLEVGHSNTQLFTRSQLLHQYSSLLENTKPTYSAKHYDTLANMKLVRYVVVHEKPTRTQHAERLLEGGAYEGPADWIM
jgi:hypothetical protein